MSRLVVVVENTSLHPDLVVEHGLSLWVELDAGPILLDTGAGRALMENLQVLKLNPLDLKGVVLSHGHYDHTGGLAGLLEARRAAGLATPVWCHADVFAPHLAQRPGKLEYIGPPLKDRAAYEKLGAEFHFVQDRAEPWPGVTLLGPIPRRNDFEGPAPNLVIQQDGDLAPDPLRDDLALVLEGDRGLCLLTGCAHSGVINLLTACRDQLGREPVLLAGGTHLGPAPAAQRERALEELARRENLTVAAGHCTGESVLREMARRLGRRLVELRGGLELRL